MSHRRIHNAALWKERRAEGVVKKPLGLHEDWYGREYRRGRDPYRIARDRHDPVALNRRFRGYLDGVRDPDQTPAWIDAVAVGPASIRALRCPARAS